MLMLYNPPSLSLQASPLPCCCPGKPHHINTGNPSEWGSQVMLLTPPPKRSADPDLPLCILTANPPPARPQMQAQSLHSALFATQEPSA